MKKCKLGLLAGVLWAMVSCGETGSNLKYESAHTNAYDGVIKTGVVFSKSSNEWLVDSEIRNQLQFVVGQLNGLYGGADLSRTQITVKSKTAVGDLWKIEYEAQLLVAWPVERQVGNYKLYLPKQGNYEYLSDMLGSYGESSGCLDYSAYDVGVGSFWYYYRPEKRGCAIGSGDHSHVIPTEISLTFSGENTDGKSPEYDKVWEDGKLVVTSIFGKNEIDGQNWDAGTRAYSQFFGDLLSTYGLPYESTYKDFNHRPTVDTPKISMKFGTAHGTLEVHMFLVGSIQSASSDFYETYNELTKISDFVSYSGHSGLGANIRALAGMGEFAAGQYQIFLVNGCDTFAYVDDSLAAAHARVNPGSKGSKYLDIMVNAMPSYFHMNSRSNMAVITALANKKKSYFEILSDFDPNQRAIVLGEEDNSWPERF